MFVPQDPKKDPLTQLGLTGAGGKYIKKLGLMFHKPLFAPSA
jgi:hypothetical protein